MSDRRARPAPRTLKLRCATWDQVEAFCDRKIKADRTLVIRVPFNPKKGDPVSIGLGLPNEMVMDIEGAVVAAKPAPDGKRAQILLKLHGMTDSVLGRLRALVRDGRDDAPTAEGAHKPIPPRPRKRREPTVPPPAAPTDAPVDEVVAQPALPTVDGVAQDEREVFLALEAEHRRLREHAAHEVLGVPWDADVATIRRGYFGLVKKHHPDTYARHRSEPIMALAEEVFIHINKAYDRMRDAAAEAGKGIIAGPALLPHKGWVAGLDDVDDALPGDDVVVDTTVRGAEFLEPPPPPVTVRFGGEAPREEGAPPPSVSELEPPKTPPAPSIEPAPLTADGLFGDIEEPSERLAATPAADTSQVDHLLATGAAAPDDRDTVAGLADEAETALARDDYDAAVEKLADALHIDARNRPLRALYHVARGHQLAEQGKAVDATTQYETALRHDPDCGEARDALKSRRASKKKGLFGRFRK